MLTFAILLPLIGSLVLAFAPRLDGSVAPASAVGPSVLPLAALVLVSLDFAAFGPHFHAVAASQWIPSLALALPVRVDALPLAPAPMPPVFVLTTLPLP